MDLIHIIANILAALLIVACIKIMSSRDLEWKLYKVARDLIKALAKIKELTKDNEILTQKLAKANRKHSM